MQPETNLAVLRRIETIMQFCKSRVCWNRFGNMWPSSHRTYLDTVLSKPECSVLFLR